MIRHLTASLSYGDTPPDYRHIFGDHLTDAQVHDVVENGGSVHMHTLARASQHLRYCGLSSSDISGLLAVADGNVAGFSLEI